MGYRAHSLHSCAAARAGDVLAVLTHSIIFPDTQSHGPKRDRLPRLRYCMQNLAD